MIAIVDTGPLYAVVDADDEDHARSIAVLERSDLDLVVPALVVAEAAYLVGRRLGPRIEAEFVRSLGSLEVEPPLPDEWASIANVVERYGDLPLGTTDASVAVLADRLSAEVIVTLDHRHFTAVRYASGRPYRLLPE